MKVNISKAEEYIIINHKETFFENFIIKKIIPKDEDISEKSQSL